MTLGEKRVNTSFKGDNLREKSQQSAVDNIKILSAQLINELEALRSEDCSGEKHRKISHAQTCIETASYYGCAAIFTK